MIRQSFSLRVLIIAFLLLALPLLVDSMILFQNSYNSLVEEMNKNLMAAGEITAVSLDEIQPFKHEFVRELALFLDIPNNLEKKELLSEELKKVVNFEKGLQIDILAYNDTGEYPIIISSDPAHVGTTFISFTYIKDLPKNKIKHFIHISYSKKKKRYVPFLYKALSIVDKNDNIIAYLMISFDVEQEINEIFADALRSRPEMNFAIGDFGIIFDASDPKIIGQTLNKISPELRAQTGYKQHFLGNIEVAKAPLTLIKTSKDARFFEFIYDNNIQLAYLTRATEMSTFVLAYFPKNILFQQAVNRFLFLYISIGLIILVGGATAYWFTRFISSPLVQLSHLMKYVREGHLDYRFKKQRFGFEINALGMVFNETLDLLYENMQKAENLRIAKETYAKQLELGMQAQRKLLPESLPQIPHIELSALYLPLAEVGGDFYGVMQKGDKLILFIADVSGKGLSSPIYSLGLRSQLRAFATLYDDVGKILTSTNALFCKDTGDTGMFATVLMGIFDIKTREFSYYSCGHTPPLLRRKNGQLIRLSHTGLAMGLLDTQECHPESIKLEPEDTLIFYTNGIFQTENERHQFFGTHRLFEILQQRRWFTADEIVKGIVKEVDEFRGDAPRESEISLLVMRLLD